MFHLKQMLKRKKERKEKKKQKKTCSKLNTVFCRRRYIIVHSSYVCMHHIVISCYLIFVLEYIRTFILTLGGDVCKPRRVFFLLF